MFNFNLAERVKIVIEEGFDEGTSFEGIIVSRKEDINGKILYEVQPFNTENESTPPLEKVIVTQKVVRKTPFVLAPRYSEMDTVIKNSKKETSDKKGMF